MAPCWLIVSIRRCLPLSWRRHRSPHWRQSCKCVHSWPLSILPILKNLWRRSSTREKYRSTRWWPGVFSWLGLGWFDGRSRLSSRASIGIDSGRFRDAWSVISKYNLPSVADLLSLATPGVEEMSRATILKVLFRALQSTLSSRIRLSGNYSGNLHQNTGSLTQLECS